MAFQDKRPDIRKLDPKLLEILKRYDIDPMWALWDCHGTPVILHKAIEWICAKADIRFDPPTILEHNLEKKIASMLVVGRMADPDGKGRDIVEWSTGEAATYNNKNEYPFAMAEKRAKDRVALKLTRLSSYVHSEEEADDFKESKPREQAKPQAAPASQTGPDDDPRVAAGRHAQSKPQAAPAPVPASKPPVAAAPKPAPNREGSLADEVLADDRRRAAGEMSADDTPFNPGREVSTAPSSAPKWLDDPTPGPKFGGKPWRYMVFGDASNKMAPATIDGGRGSWLQSVANYQGSNTDLKAKARMCLEFITNGVWDLPRGAA